ncbi:MAG: sugar phosphate nucleotidyltransferase, partial [Hyphomicrobiales bacterium]|nr:sugar phosphate nucleotidyltransferase [Hyphomicrobiales bacterium]
VPDNETHQYGIVGIEQKGADLGITQMVEKPAKGTSPSNLAISGRYILKPEIFDILATQERGSGGEIQLTDAMITLAKSQDFYAHLFDGDIYDTGMKIGFLTANLALGLAHPELGAPLRAAIKRMGL